MAIEEERISRKKYDKNTWFPYLALDKVLKEKNITLTQVNDIAVSWDISLFCNTKEDISHAKRAIHFSVSLIALLFSLISYLVATGIPMVIILSVIAIILLLSVIAAIQIVIGVFYHRDV